jgi:tetrahydromethanopterin S-methyltransferase subunit H
MNITLRRASALQNSIQEAIKAIRVETEVELNEFQNVDAAITAALDAMQAAVAQRDALTVALYTIRGQVSAANSVAGIDQRLTQAAMIDKQLGYVTEIASAKVAQDRDVILGRLDKIRAAPADRRSIYGFDSTVSTSILSAYDIAAARARVQELKKAKQRINDEVLELNIRTEIELTADTQNTLQAAGLV